MAKDSELKDKLEEMLNQARNPEIAREALGMLFPKASQALRTFMSSSDDFVERRNKRRISVRQFSTSYFQLAPIGENWSRAEINSVLSEMDPRRAMELTEARIERASDQDRPRLRREFLEALDGRFRAERQALSPAWLLAIVNASPKYIAARDQDRTSFFPIENFDRLRWAIIAPLKEMSAEQRAEILMAVVPQAQDLSILSDVVRTAVGDLQPDGAGSKEEEFGVGDKKEPLRQLLLSRIRSLAVDGSIWNQAEPSHLLWFWWACGLDDEVREFTTRALGNRSWALSLMNSSISEIHASNRGTYEIVNRESYSKIVDLAHLKEIAQRIATDGTLREREVAERFLSALEADEKRR